MSSTLLPPRPGPMRWDGWGDPDRRVDLDASSRRLLERELGALGQPRAPVPLAAVDAPPTALDGATREALASIVGADHVHVDDETRVRHAGGRSYPDLVRRRRGDAGTAPDAVVAPADGDEVQRLVERCGDLGVALVPFGGGTSVVGGVEPSRGGFEAVISLDLQRLDRVVALDRTSGVATLEPGLRGADAERRLRERGVSLGHYPQSYEYATVGGYAATRSAGQASTGFGRFDDLVVGLTCATPSGAVRLGRAPRSAAGPDLRHLLVGSEGAFGVITEVDLRVRPAPTTERHEVWAVRSFAQGAEILRRLAQREAAPDLARLSDRDESRVGLARVEGLRGALVAGWLRARGVGEGCLLVLGWAGAERAVERRRAAAVEVLDDFRVAPLGAGAGRSWARDRFEGPYLRDALLDHGVLVETLETATSWSGLGELYHAVRAALTSALRARGTPPLVLCHVSHLYPTGASLYFTWLARQEQGAEVEQWAAAKRAAGDAIVAAGGTITHHHAIGRDHLPWLEDEIGERGVAALRAVKSALDPDGIMNPGVLVPPDRPTT